MASVDLTAALAFASVWSIGQAEAAPAATAAPAAPAVSEQVGQPKAPAATTGAPGVTPIPVGGTQPPPNPFGGGFMLMMLLLLGFMITMTVISGRREKKKRTELMSSLRTNDKVQTLGGIIGTIAEIRDDEVVLRVDENSNTRIRFAKSAIQQVLRPAGGGANGVAEAKPAGQKVTA